MKIVGRLSDEVYRSMLESVPVPTADFVLTRMVDGHRWEFLLTKRMEKPYKGNWFVPGGRIFRGEKMADAVRRNCKRELGFTPENVIFMGCLDVWNPPKMGTWWHSIWHFHVIEVPADIQLSLNHENASAQWFSRVNPRWPLPVRQALALAGFK